MPEDGQSFEGDKRFFPSARNKTRDWRQVSKSIEFVNGELTFSTVVSRRQWSVRMGEKKKSAIVGEQIHDPFLVFLFFVDILF